MDNNNETNQNVVTEEPVTQPVVEPVTEAPAPVQEVPTPVASETPTPETPKKKGVPLLLIALIVVLAGFAAWYFALGGKEVLSGKKEEPKEEEPIKEETKKEEEKQVEPKEEEKQEEKKEEEKTEENQNENKQEDNKQEEVTPKVEQEKDDLYKVVEYFIDYNTSGKTKIVISELSSEELLRAALDIGGVSKNDTISEEDMKAAVKKLFGDIPFNNESIKCRGCGNLDYIYSSENKNYTINKDHDGHGGANSVYNTIYFVSSGKNEAKGTITVNYKIIYAKILQDVSYWADDDNFYPTITDMLNKTNGLYSTPVDPEITFAKVYEEFGDKIPTTKAIFKVDGENRYLQSIELP